MSVQDLKQIIASNIIFLRRKEGMTQLDLAEKLNYTDKAISKWERGESVPDISVLKMIADLFHVTVDYLITEEHPEESLETLPEVDAEQGKKRWRNNHFFIMGMAVILVWFIATLSYVVISLANPDVVAQWLAFLYAVPVSCVVWLVFNSVWFSKRRNFLIISLLMWAALAAIQISFCVFGQNIWLIYVLGVPGQIIILMWSRIRHRVPGKSTQTKE